MPNVTYISSTGETTTIDVPMGTTVMENAIKNGIDGIVAECDHGDFIFLAKAIDHVEISRCH